MWYASIDNRLWVKFTSNRCDFFNQRKNRSGQEVQVQECHREKRNWKTLFQSSSPVNPYSSLLELHSDSFSRQCFHLAERIARVFFQFLCSTKLCLWTVRPPERHCLSALRRLHLAAFTSSVIHGADGRAVTVRVTSGACLKRIGGDEVEWTTGTANIRKAELPTVQAVYEGQQAVQEVQHENKFGCLSWLGKWDGLPEIT